MEAYPVLNSDEQLLAVLVKLDECRTTLLAGGHGESAHLVSVAALDLRMKLNQIDDADLKLLCDAITAKAHIGDLLQEAAYETKASTAANERPLLRVVK